MFYKHYNFFLANEYELSSRKIFFSGNQHKKHCNDSYDNRVELRFRRSELVPDILDYPPKNYLIVEYPTGVRAKLGNTLTPTEVQYKPKVIWPANKRFLYTLIMTDADVPSRNDPNRMEVRHWFVVNIPGSNIKKGQTVIEFIGSAPDPNTGKHRYSFLVFKQSSRIVTDLYVADDTSTDQSPRLSGSVRETINQYNLGRPLFGNFYLAPYDDTAIKIRDQIGIPIQNN